MSYTTKVNGQAAQHPTYESAAASWDRVSLAVEDGRSIEAELWQHESHEWDEDFYQGLLDPATGTLNQSPDSDLLFIAIPGKAIISRRCIAKLTFP